MATPQIILCTGANRGLGFEIIHVAALRAPSAIYVLACRQLSSGHEAVQELRKLGVTAEIEVVQLDVTKNEEIEAAVKFVERKYGRLDVLVNNAGIALFPGTTLFSIRETYNILLETNITSVAVMTSAFLPLLHASHNRPKVINVSSGLASIARVRSGNMHRATAYGASKIGLNGLTVHMQMVEDELAAKAAAAKAAAATKGKGKEAAGIEEAERKISFYSITPGFLRTAFTNHSPYGKDPKDGAEVVVRLALEEGGHYEGATYWEFEWGRMREVPW